MLKIVTFPLKGKGKPSIDFSSERFNPEVELGDKKRLNTKKSCHETLGREGKGNSATQIILLFNFFCFQFFWGLSCAFRKEALLCTVLKMLIIKNQTNRSTRMHLIALNDLFNCCTTLIIATIKKILSHKLLFCCYSTTFKIQHVSMYIFM